MRSNTATAALLVAIGSLAAVVTVDADASTKASTEYLEHCQLCPPDGCPPEHHDSACDRPRQNALWVAADAADRAARPEDKISDAAYLRLPEEQTWTCPLDAAGEGGEYAGAYGRVTRWIVRNEASAPVVLSHVNALGLEVSATDFRTYPAHADTAVYPHGPILPPGQVAVVEGRQGQLFVAREYREVLPMEARLAATEDEAFGHSWESFKRALPPTLSFLPDRARYKTGKGVWHVLGKPGRVLLKHRLGNIHVKNQFGALCPEAMGASAAAADAPAPRDSLPKDMNPACNVLVKAFLNTVGCPVDVFFAPPHRGAAGYDCERFQAHLGTRAAYAAPGAGRARHLDDPASPLKFPNTYTGHAFVARMAHDGALVARIAVDRDVVRDCPAPAREGAGGAARGVPGVLAAANATVPVHAADQWRAVVRANGTSAPVFLGKVHQEKYDIGWQNTTGVMLASAPIAS